MISRLFASRVAAVSDALALTVKSSNATSVAQQIRTMMTFTVHLLPSSLQTAKKFGQRLGFSEKFHTSRWWRAYFRTQVGEASRYPLAILCVAIHFLR
jgi:hypothetical protein